MANSSRHLSGMERRYELLPQMRDYDGVGFDWTPYIMWRNQPDFRSGVFNTDEHGFRHTLKDNQCLDYQMFQDHSGLKGVVCGGSAAFGVGATGDNKTIPSLLNVDSETLWFNFGVRAFNSTQELLLFLFHLPEVQKVLLFTGVNNLVSQILAERYTLPYGGIVQDQAFNHLNHNLSPSTLLLRSMGRRLRNLIPLGGKSLAPLEFEPRFEESLKVIERDLELWRILRDSRGFSLLYFLQPFGGWTKKQTSPEEQELFDILDEQQGPNWLSLFKQITEGYPRYANQLQHMCEDKEIPFVDGNKLLPDQGWMFCDRIHLTDQGNGEIVSTLKCALV